MTLRLDTHVVQVKTNRYGSARSRSPRCLMSTWSSVRVVADGEINRVTGIAQVMLGAGINSDAGRH